MPVQGDLEVQTWRELISMLPGVLGVEFRLEGDSVREVHVLSDQSRGPKQVVRDVQSAMQARFQIELDHRTISVAQIPGQMMGSRGRFLCERIEVSRGREYANVTVHLSLDGTDYSGQAEYELSRASRFRAVARATVVALNQTLTAGHAFSVEEVREVVLAERPVLLVGLLLATEGRMEPLLGACYMGEDANFSAVLATLDAANRRLATLPMERHAQPAAQ